MQVVSLLVLLPGLLFLPGWLITGAFAQLRPRVLFAVAISFSIGVLSVLAGKLAMLPSQSLLAVWTGVAATSVVLFIWRVPVQSKPALVLLGWSRPDSITLVGISITLAVLVYSLIVGPYVEVPADPIWHLGLIRDKYDLLTGGSSLKIVGATEIFHKLNHYWYFLIASVVWASGLSLDQAIYWINTFNSVLLLVAVFGFGLAVMQSVFDKPVEAVSVAALGCVLFFLHFGLSVFSFVRYYTFGPVFLNFTVFLASSVAIERYLKSSRIMDPWMYLVLMGLFVTALAHTQEALFIMIMGSLMLLLATWRCLKQQNFRLLPGDAHSRKLYLLSVAWIVGYLGTHGYLYFSVVRNNPLLYGVMTDVNALIPFLKNLYVLKPDYQFYQVITVWGVVVFICFFFLKGAVNRSLIITAGMVSPIFTLFNPVFTDLFLRVSWPEVLWRMSFVIPLGLVGAYYLLIGFKWLLTEKSIRKKVVGALVCISLVLFLFPIDNRFFESKWSRIEMLKPVADGNDVRVWWDLITQLRSMPKETILTDQVTGYTINAYTSHTYPSHKFSGYGILKLNNDSYEIADIRPYHDWLLIINMKDGEKSWTGKIGKHWSQRAMKTRLFYSENFLRLVDEHPQNFELLWDQQTQKIYRIKIE